MTEYRVMERESKSWEKHGYEGRSLEEAIIDFNHKMEVYGKYHREFRLESREVTNWKSLRLNCWNEVLE